MGMTKVGVGSMKCCNRHTAERNPEQAEAFGAGGIAANEEAAAARLGFYLQQYQPDGDDAAVENLPRECTGGTGQIDVSFRLQSEVQAGRAGVVACAEPGAAHDCQHCHRFGPERQVIDDSRQQGQTVYRYQPVQERTGRLSREVDDRQGVCGQGRSTPGQRGAGVHTGRSRGGHRAGRAGA